MSDLNVTMQCLLNGEGFAPQVAHIKSDSGIQNFEVLRIYGPQHYVQVVEPNEENHWQGEFAYDNRDMFCLIVKDVSKLLPIAEEIAKANGAFIGKITEDGAVADMKGDLIA